MKKHLWQVLYIYIGSCVFQKQIPQIASFLVIGFCKLPKNLSCHRLANITNFPYLPINFWLLLCNKNVRLEYWYKISELTKVPLFYRFLPQNSSQQGSDIFHTNTKHLIIIDFLMKSFVASFEFQPRKLHFPKITCFMPFFCKMPQNVACHKNIQT